MELPSSQGIRAMRTGLLDSGGSTKDIKKKIVMVQNSFVTWPSRPYKTVGTHNFIHIGALSPRSTCSLSTLRRGHYCTPRKTRLPMVDTFRHGDHTHWIPINGFCLCFFSLCHKSPPFLRFAWRK